MIHLTRRGPGFAQGTAVWAAALACLLGQPAQAVSFGIYDARTMAMGGTAVASAKSANAVFYNPALLSMYDVRKEKANNSRFGFPLLTAQVSDAAREASALDTDDLDTRLAEAVVAFNANPSPGSAAVALAAVQDIQGVLAGLADEDLIVDATAALVIGVPGKREGGSFFVGSRLVGGGLADVSEADRQLLDAYVEGLSFIATQGAQGSPRPDLFDANGDLIDPGNNLNSSAEARGAIINEIGVAFSKEFSIFAHPVALGLTPKIVVVKAAESRSQLVADGVSVSENGLEHEMLNLDFGAVYEWNRHYRFGLALKDVYPRDYATGLGGDVRIRPRLRAGGMYHAGALRLAVDIDLIRNLPVGTESENQEIGAGVEWGVFGDWMLRGGYRLNVADGGSGIASAGISIPVFNTAFEFAYGKGPDREAAAFQFGFAF